MRVTADSRAPTLLKIGAEWSGRRGNTAGGYEACSSRDGLERVRMGVNLKVQSEMSIGKA